MVLATAINVSNNTQELVCWSDALSVGIEEIDEQHKVLVDLLNQLHTAIIQHHGSESSNRILIELVEYTRIHFAVEESLMRILGYPEYEEHKHHHSLLINEVRMLVTKLHNGKKSISFELLHFLKIWLTKHIMDEDRQYVPFLIRAGVNRKHQQQSWMGKFWNTLTH